MLCGVVVGLILLQAPQPGAPPAPPPTAVIIGRVVDAGSGAPLAGAIVSIGTPATRDTAPRLLTDPQGRFIYRNLPAGTYSLNASLAGYLDGGYGRRRHDGPVAVLELAAGERATDVTILMWRHGSITGTLVDEAGEPMVGASVRAYRRRRAGGRVTWSPTGLTYGADDRGVYRISRLPPGEYVVTAGSTSVTVPASLADAFRAGGATNDPARRALQSTIFSLGSFSTVTSGPMVTRVGDHQFTLDRGLAVPAGEGLPASVYPLTYHPGTPVIAEATIVTVASGEERAGIDIHLRPVPAVKVSGVVTLPDGPAAHVPVKLEPPEHTGLSNPMTSLNVGPATATDANGAFTFLNVPSGSYTLRVVKAPAAAPPAEGMTTTVIQSGGAMTFSSVSVGDTVSQPLPAEPTWAAVLPVQVGRRDITNLQVPLQAGGRLSGRIEFEGTSERPDETQIRRLGFSLNSAEGAFVSGARGQFSADGTFRTTSLAPGRYTLFVGSVRGWSLKSAVLEGRDVADLPIEVGTSDIGGIVMTFTDRPPELSGAVQGANGPDADASVIVFPTDPATWNTPTMRRTRITRTSKSGTFSLKALPAGEYYVIAMPDALATDWNDPRSLEAFAREATRVDVAEGTKTISLRTTHPRRQP